MISDFLSAMWAAIAAELGNHLWQSTLFAAAAGLLTLTLRKNQARARYWLWLAASVKFLIPFSWLVGVGRHLARPRQAATNNGLSFVIDQVTQPFASTAAPAGSHMAAPVLVPHSLLKFLPMAVPTVWVCGLAAVLFLWCMRWRRIREIKREARPLGAGREVEALRRLESRQGLRKPLKMLVSRFSLEPGILGIARPVLIWPLGVSKHLEDAHLEAILTHEVQHVRRRDNLAAAMHMLVEAAFWFHPLVWWLGKRLVEERERACDEQVLESGSEPAVYAESILKTCEFCVGSPLACVSGVAGADLKKRIVRIVTQRIEAKLSLSRKLLLATTATVAVAGPVIGGLFHASPVRAQSPLTGTPLATYDVASIKPDHLDGHHTRVDSTLNSLTVTGMTLKRLIAYAYNVNDFQISGGPAWSDSETYEIRAKLDDSTVEELKKLPRTERRKQNRLMIQALLADRFKLKLSHSSRDLPIYALVLMKGGPKFSRSTSSGDSQNLSSNNDDVKVESTIGHFAEWLSSVLGRKVVDETGLEGNYAFKLNYDHRQLLTPSGPADDRDDSAAPSIFSALRDQLGLKLEAKKGQVETLIIDLAEKPSPN
jgi:uncharacterized protein (TIGR03435 family)